jgi:uncharacterized protein (TIGR03437 family)
LVNVGIGFLSCNETGLSCVNRYLNLSDFMKKFSIACGLWIATGSLFAQQYSISTIAGTAGSPGWSGDQGPALSAQFHNPTRVAVDNSGNVYLTDYSNSSVRVVYTNGMVGSITGNGSPGFSGDGKSSSGAQLASPNDIAIDSASNLYIADTGNSRIRIISSGVIRTFAGTTRGIAGGSLGNGGPAASAQLIEPTGVAVDKSGNVYIADIGNATVRKVSPGGTISAFAGVGYLTWGAYAGEGGPATQALLGVPYSLATDPAGNVYIVDIGLGRLFKIGSDGIIHTVKTNFAAQNCAVDAAGNIYAAVYSNNTVEKILPGGTTLWIGGNGISGYTGDNGPGTSASMEQPYGVALDLAGNVYVAEALNAIVRKLTPVPFSIGAISNAATNQPFAAPASGSGDATVPISPGEIVTLFGTGLGPANLVVNTLTNGLYGTQVGGTAVTIGGTTAPILYASSTFVSVIVPYEINGLTSTTVSVTYQGQQSVVNTVPVAASAPGLFTLDTTGSGQALAVNFPSGTLNTPSSPTPAGNFVILYATGEGQTTPAGADGRLAPAAPPFPIPIQPVTATVGGLPAVVNYAGAAPGFVAGVMQVNVQIPVGVLSGAAQVQLTIDNLLSPIVTVSVQ